jgi:uncharacterized protein YegL
MKILVLVENLAGEPVKGATIGAEQLDGRTIFRYEKTDSHIEFEDKGNPYLGNQIRVYAECAGFLPAERYCEVEAREVKVTFRLEEKIKPAKIQQPPVPRYPDNPVQRTPCVLVLDASNSMNTRTSDGGSRIARLNEGLRTLEIALKRDPVAETHVQLAIVCVGGSAGESSAAMLTPWIDANDFRPPHLIANGMTPLARGLILALESVEQQKRVLKAEGIAYTRPWVMVITDGQATDSDNDWQRAAAACRAAETSGKCIIYPIGVEGVNAVKLQEVTSTKVMLLAGLKFNELFQWLSTSLAVSSRSKAGEIVQLPGTDPWSMFRA